MENPTEKILFVDLDGTYTKTDLLYENFLVAFKLNPLIIFKCLQWLLKGKAHLKQRLSELVDLDISYLPLNQEFVSFLKEEKEKGRSIYLATASTEKFAKSIVEQSDLFDGYIASCGHYNLKGHVKLEKINQISPQFAYAGNDIIDFTLFEHTNESYLVNPTPKALNRSRLTSVTKTFDVNKFQIDPWIKQLRIYQWLKNLLIFVPLVVSGNFAELENILLSVVAFLAFSLLASSTYILNDLMDLESDRHHPRKRFRPIAAGEISIVDAIFVGAFLLFTPLLMATFLSFDFLLVLLAYLSLTLLYSFKIKQYIGIDVLVLALLYTIRIIAGAVAIDVLTSFWLLAFSIFIFLSLALVKRCSEIRSLETEGKSSAKGRNYMVQDYAVLKSFGVSSAMLSVLMFCFYINNNVLINQYQKPDLLWLIVPGLCYWLMHMWIKTHRGEMHDDPIIFSLKDKGSLLTVCFCGFTAIISQIL